VSNAEHAALLQSLRGKLLGIILAADSVCCLSLAEADSPFFKLEVRKELNLLLRVKPKLPGLRSLLQRIVLNEKSCDSSDAIARNRGGIRKRSPLKAFCRSRARREKIQKLRFGIQEAVVDMMRSLNEAWSTRSSAAYAPSRSLLERYGLRATRQRLWLAKLLFSKGDRHVTADSLAAEANALKISASLATVYNVLNLFAQVGLVRGLAIEGTKTVYDTNTSDHGHFFFEVTGEIEDIGVQGPKLVGEVEPPNGYEIVRVDVVVRLRRKKVSLQPSYTPLTR
jgi:Fur family iron response transcriptional regulator